MNALSKIFYRYKKVLKVAKLYLLIAGPGIIVMVADNDAGGITPTPLPRLSTASTSSGS